MNVRKYYSHALEQGTLGEAKIDCDQLCEQRARDAGIANESHRRCRLFVRPFQLVLHRVPNVANCESQSILLIKRVDS